MNNTVLHLVDLHPTTVPDLNYGYNSLGVIGQGTGILDVNGEEIMVGDVVKTTKPNRWWSSLIIHHENAKGKKYYTVNGMASAALEEIIAERKVERVVPYIHINQEFRRHINHIALSETYLDINWDFVNDKWTKVRGI